MGVYELNRVQQLKEISLRMAPPGQSSPFDMECGNAAGTDQDEEGTWVQRGRRPFGDVCTKQLSDNDEGRNWQGRERGDGVKPLCKQGSTMVGWSLGSLFPWLPGVVRPGKMTRTINE